MAGNTIGNIFRLTTFGESHGDAVGGMVDGCPAGIELDFARIDAFVNLRKSRQKYETSRRESDEVRFLSGIFDGRTLGTPIAFIIENRQQNSEDYRILEDSFRPSHGDFTSFGKYGIRDWRGGGRCSARETAARVVAGAIALQVLEKNGISVVAYTHQIGNVRMRENMNFSAGDVAASKLHCPDHEAEKQMLVLLKTAENQEDTVGGVVECRISGCPVGLGEPVFDKLSADLAKAVMSIPSAKGFEFGSGFRSAEMKGSEYIDLFNEDFSTKTNNSGGIQGGISNGMDIVFRVAFHPIVTLAMPVEVVTVSGTKKTVSIGGRHDCCQVPRAVPIVASMAAITVLDNLLLQKNRI